MISTVLAFIQKILPFQKHCLYKFGNMSKSFRHILILGPNWNLIVYQFQPGPMGAVEVMQCAMPGPNMCPCLSQDEVEQSKLL